MIIAINCSYYAPNSGGIKEYIYNLLENLSNIDNRNEYIVYVSPDNYKYAKDTLPRSFKIKQTSFSSKHPIIRSLFEAKFYRKEENVEKFDIFHSPFFHSPKLKKAKVIITVHDLRLYRYPQTYTFFRYFFLKYKVKKSVASAKHIIAISNFTKNELTELTNVNPNKITVIHEAINKSFFNLESVNSYIPKLPPEILPQNFILTVGHIEPRKNYVNLIQAFENLANKEIKLVIVGKKNHDYKKVLELIEQNKRVFYLDFVDSKSLLWLYKNAKFFVFPSYYEGFGFPPLEAAALNTVSVVSNVSSIPEICGKAAFYFDPFSVADITNVLDDLLKNENKIKNKKEELEATLNKYSWKKNAVNTLELYEKIAKT